MKEVPADHGFWLPPDWQRHERCWLAWPYRPESWAGFYDHACLSHAALARAICEYEPTTVLVRPGVEDEARLQLGRAVDIAPLALDDSWLRDIGPGILVNDEAQRAGVAFRFNGWGNRVHGYEADAAFAQWLPNELNLPAFPCPLTMECSGVQVDGIGTLIALTSGLLDDNRNPTLSPQDVEELLAMFLGARKIVWLDDTLWAAAPWRQTVDVVRFCGPAHVLVAAGFGPDDPLAGELDLIAEQLASERDGLGRTLQVGRVPRAAPRDELDARGFGSYLNYYLGNGAVMVPQFGHEHDEEACALIRDAFPKRDVVAIDVGVLRHRNMGWHSLTLPIPAPMSGGG